MARVQKCWTDISLLFFWTERTTFPPRLFAMDQIDVLASNDNKRGRNGDCDRLPRLKFYIHTTRKALSAPMDRR